MQKLLLLLFTYHTLFSLYDYPKTLIELIKKNLTTKNLCCLTISTGLVKLEKYLTNSSITKEIDDFIQNRKMLTDEDRKLLEYTGNLLLFKSEYLKSQDSNKPHSDRIYNKLTKGLLIYAQEHEASITSIGFPTDKESYTFFFIISLLHSALYAPLYYFMLKIYIDYQSMEINPMKIIFISETITILTKIILKKFRNKKKYSYWQDINQKYISALLLPITVFIMSQNKI